MVSRELKAPSSRSKMAGNDDWLYNDDLDVGLPGVREGDGGSSKVVESWGP